MHATVEGEKSEVREGAIEGMKEVAQRLLRVWRAVVDALEPEEDSSTTSLVSEHPSEGSFCVFTDSEAGQEMQLSAAGRNKVCRKLWSLVPPVDWQVDPALCDAAFCTL